jgi:hypothetical protein
MNRRTPAGAERARRWPDPLVLLVLLVGLALLLAACGGTASTGPGDSSGPSADASTEPSDAPRDEPTGSAEPTGGFDFSPAAENLNNLDSYKFNVEITSANAQGGQAAVLEGTTTMSGTVNNAPSEASSLHLVTKDKDGNTTDETEIVIIAADAWLRSGGATGDWQAIPAAQAPIFLQLMDSFRPEQMFSVFFAPIGTDNERVGDEDRNGVPTTHYRGGEAVSAILGTIAGVQGSWTSDIWIARDGAYLVASEAGVQGSDANGGGSFSLIVNITDIESADNVVEPPI